MGSQRGASWPPYDEEARVEYLLEKLRNPLTACVAHATDVHAHTPVRLFPVRVQDRISSARPQEDLLVQVSEDEEDHQEA